MGHIHTMFRGCGLNRYLGFFDMNPANLNKLSPAESAPKYVAAMGGADNIM